VVAHGCGAGADAIVLEALQGTFVALAQPWTRDARDVPVTSMSSSTTAAPHRAMAIQLLAGPMYLDPAIRRAVGLVMARGATFVTTP
jgi:hypothetical protein